MAPQNAAAPSVDLGRPGFGEILRVLNPLQYMPVVGTIYRLATGDSAPVGLRTAVSAVVGVLTGGPVGLLGSIFGSLAEQMFHVEDHVRQALAPVAASRGVAAKPSQATPNHAQAEADLGAQSARATAAVAAYRAAGLLGAV